MFCSRRRSAAAAATPATVLAAGHGAVDPHKVFLTLGVDRLHLLTMRLGCGLRLLAAQALGVTIGAAVELALGVQEGAQVQAVGRLADAVQAKRLQPVALSVGQTECLVARLTGRVAAVRGLRAAGAGGTERLHLLAGTLAEGLRLGDEVGVGDRAVAQALDQGVALLARLLPRLTDGVALLVAEPSPVSAALAASALVPSAALPVAALPVAALPVAALPVAALPVAALPVAALPVAALASGTVAALASGTVAAHLAELGDLRRSQDVEHAGGGRPPGVGGRGAGGDGVERGGLRLGDRQALAESVEPVAEAGCRVGLSRRGPGQSEAEGERQAGAQGGL